jgi:hypothetical protein
MEGIKKLPDVTLTRSVQQTLRNNHIGVPTKMQSTSSHMGSTGVSMGLLARKPHCRNVKNWTMRCDISCQLRRSPESTSSNQSINM